MNNRRSDKEELSFANLANFASEPPPAETVDVHSACTAVAALPDSFLDDLRRGVLEKVTSRNDPTTSRYNVLPDTLLQEVPPTRPPPPLSPRSSETRVRELNAAISTALADAVQRIDAPADLCVPAPLPVPLPPPPDVALASAEVVEPAASPACSPAVPAIPIHDDERWVVILLAVAVVFALLAAGSGISF